MSRVLGKIVSFIIAVVIARFRQPKRKVKEVINVKYPLHKKAS